jgi:hypothetical protein
MIAMLDKGPFQLVGEDVFVNIAEDWRSTTSGASGCVHDCPELQKREH